MGRLSQSLLALCLMLVLPIAAEEVPDETAAERCEEYAGVALPSFVNDPIWAGKSEYACMNALYGFDSRPDPRKAIQCCITTDQCKRYAAMAFANGWGVKRNYRVAAHLLCRAEKEMAPLEWWSMLDHLWRIQSGEEKKDLDFCDHMTSGRGAAFCALLDGWKLAPKLEKRIAKLRRELSPALMPLFEKVDSRGVEFSKTEAERIGDEARGGSLYSSYVINAGNGVSEILVDLLEKYSRQRAPAATTEEWLLADAGLNTTYQEQIATSEECPECVDHLRAAQRSWIAWRDAWADYYAARWRGMAEEDTLRLEIVRHLTAERQKGLLTNSPDR